MVRVCLFTIAALALGALVALVALRTGVAVGWLGAGALVGWAILARIRWTRLENSSVFGVGAPERALWIRAAGMALIVGHLITALAHPHLDLHVGRGNSLAIDSWTMTGAFVLSILIFRRDGHIRDERHNEIAAFGVAAGYVALAGSTVIAALFLAFAPPQSQAMLSRFAIANVLIALTLASYLVMLVVQLALYRLDAAAAERSAS